MNASASPGMIVRCGAPGCTEEVEVPQDARYWYTHLPVDGHTLAILGARDRQRHPLGDIAQIGAP